MLTSHLRRVFLLLSVFVWMAPSLADGSANGIDEGGIVGIGDELRLASGLRERRLFDQAAFVCNEALAKLKGSAAAAREEAAFAIELIRIRTDQARLAELDRREQSWRAAKQEAANFLSTRPQHPRRILVELQAVLVDLARVNLMQQEQQFGLPSDVDRANSLTLCRGVRSELRNIDQTVARLLQDARNDDRCEPGQLGVEELTQLQRNVRFQLAEGAFQRAQLYGQEQSLNRTSALAEVMAQLDELQKANQPGTELWWQTQLALARGYRSLSDFQNAQQTLDRAAQPDVRRSRRAWHQPILIEQMELLIASDLSKSSSVRIANQLLLAVDRRPVISAQLDMSALRLLAAIYIATKADSQRRELQEQAGRRCDLIDQKHGPWWGSRARQVLLTMGDSAIGSQLADEFRALLTQAEAAGKDRPREALAALDQAAAIADKLGDVGPWRSCQVKASQLLEAVGQYQRAGERLILAANKESTHATSAALSLRGCWNLAQAVKQNSELRPVAVQALERHLETWPDADSADQAKLWLGRFQASAGEHREAVNTLLSVRSQSPRRGAAVRAAVEAAARMGDVVDAANVLEQLAKEFPGDATVLIQQARVKSKIANAGGPEEIATALDHWRRLARRLKPETDDWFEAKYNVAYLLNASGQREKAVQLMDYLSALPSGWAASPVAESLDRLKQELR